MQNKAHALAAGIFVLIIAALAVALAVWLTRDAGARNEFELSTRDGISGLRAQAAVRYRGVAVGKVLSISLDPALRGNVLVRISVDEAAPVTKSTFATLGYQGVTGSSFVQLEDNGESSELLDPSDGQVLRIPLRPGLIGTLTDRGTALLGEVEQTARRLNELLAPENQKKMFETVERIGAAAQGLQRQGEAMQAQLKNTLTQRLDPALAAVPPVVEEAARTLKALQGATAELSKTTAEISRTAADITRTSQGAARTVDEFSLVAKRLTEKGGTLDQLAQTTESVGSASTRFGASNLPSAFQATEDTSRAARQLGRTARVLGENPQQLLFGAGPAAPGPGEPGFSIPGARK